MHGRALNDGATRRDEPVKALGLREQANRATLLATFTDQGDDFNVPFEEVEIQAGSKGLQTGRVDMRIGAQKTARTAKENHANIDALTTLDARQYADEGIIIGGRGHAGPPQQRSATMPADPAGRPDRPPGAHSGRQRAGRSARNLGWHSRSLAITPLSGASSKRHPLRQAYWQMAVVHAL